MFFFCNPCHPSGTAASVTSKPPSHTHRWKIENFNWYRPNGRLHWKKYLESEQFKPEGSELAFNLRLYTYGNEFKLDLHESSSNDVDVNLRLTFEIEDRNGQGHFQKTFNHNFNQNDRFVCEKFIELAKLDENKDNLLPKDTLTICCVFEDYEYSNVFDGFTQSQSVSKPSLLSHKWTIEDFDDYLNVGKMNWKKQLNSKKFSTSDGKVEFYLSLHPNGNGVENKDHLSVSLHLTKESDVKFNCTFSLADGLKENFKSVIDKALPKEGFGYEKYISHYELKNSANNYLSQNKLTVCVYIEDVECKLIRGYRKTRSTTSTNCHVHIWTIENYSSLGTGWKWKVGLVCYIESNKFTTFNRNLPEFYLRLHPNGDEDNDYISLYLMSCVHKSEIVFNCTFAIFGNGVDTVKEFEHKFVDSNVGHDKFISRADFLDSKNGYLSNNKVIIYCAISDQNEELIRGYTETRSKTTASFFG